MKTKNEIITYLKKCPLYEIVDKFILVYAGLYVTNTKVRSIEKEMRTQTSKDLL